MRIEKRTCLYGAALLASLTGAAIVSSAGSATPAPQAATSQAVDRCAALVGHEFAGAVVEKTDFIAAEQPLNAYGAKTSAGVCRVRARLSPAAESSIKIEVWLPTAWNGKVFGSGGSGFNGGLAVAKGFLAPPVRDGYAALATDAGHDFSLSAAWALGRPEKLVDFGWRANHLGIVAAKALAASYYGAPVQRAYFHGCSNGGRDALMLAQRHPEDYDAIISGAPAYNWTAVFSGYMRKQQIARITPGVDALGSKLGLVHDAVLKTCDPDDGVKDGLISNPAQCRFDPKVLQCKAGAGSDCLSKPEVAAVRAIYRGIKGRDGRLIMPGQAPGSENEWSAWFASPKSAAVTAATDYFRNMVYGDPKWDPSTFAFERDYPESTRRVGPILNATDTNLRPFLARGGKLLMYQGWDDAAIPAGNTIAYFTAMRRASGRAAADQTRLFMAPGVGHCSGGQGPDTFDALGALDAWVQQARPPERLIASRYENSQSVAWGATAKPMSTRPICAWPKSPRYRGTGATDDAASFVCR